jgi:hypothetical protein
MAQNTQWVGLAVDAARKPFPALDMKHMDLVGIEM